MSAKQPVPPPTESPSQWWAKNRPGEPFPTSPAPPKYAPIVATSEYWCVMANCGQKATQARVMTAIVQPMCDSCAAWAKRGGSNVIPLVDALAGARD